MSDSTRTPGEILCTTRVGHHLVSTIYMSSGTWQTCTWHEGHGGKTTLYWHFTSEAAALRHHLLTCEALSVGAELPPIPTPDAPAPEEEDEEVAAVVFERSAPIYHKDEEAGF